MDKALYLAMTGAVHNNRAQALHGNNLANAGTTGFRADFAQARAMQVFGPTLPSRAYALTERPGTDLGKGSIDATGRDLDVAIAGDGFLTVQSADGSEGYTRAGNLTIDHDGSLRDGHGRAVLGDGGPIVLPPVESVTIGEDGTISIRPVGQAATTLVQQGRLKLVNPPAEAITKGGDGLFRQRDGTIAATAPAVRVTSGALETSNVNAVSEMVDILALARQFEVQIKMMKTSEEDDQVAARILQRS